MTSSTKQGDGSWWRLPEQSGRTDLQRPRGSLRWRLCELLGWSDSQQSDLQLGQQAGPRDLQLGQQVGPRDRVGKSDFRTGNIGPYSRVRKLDLRTRSENRTFSGSDSRTCGLGRKVGPSGLGRKVGPSVGRKVGPTLEGSAQYEDCSAVGKWILCQCKICFMMRNCLDFTAVAILS